MQNYKILDPNWSDQAPVIEVADSPEDAVRQFYTGTLLESPPKLYAIDSFDLGKAIMFTVTDDDGKEYNIYFE